MLQTIRDKLSGWVAKIVLGALAVVFVFWGIELRSAYSASNYAATVNGDNISLNEAHEAWQRQQTQLQQQLHGDIPEVLKKSQQQAIMDRLVNTQLLQQQVNKLGYGVSDEALVKALHDISEFKVDGKFDPERYTGMIASLGRSKSQFEHDYRNQLALQRLQNGVVNTAFATPFEAARAQALLGEQRDVEFATLSAKSFLSTVNVTDAEVQSYYDANKNSFMTPETVGLQYVELKLADVASEVTVTEEALRSYYDQIKDKFSTGERRHAHHILIAAGNGVDDAAAKKQADDLYAKLKSGANFETLAKENSKDPGSAVKGGDLGWAKRGDFVKPFEEALFSMNPGEIRGPVKSDFGYHIIRLDEIEGSSKTYEQVRAEVEADYRNEQAHSLFYDRTQKFADAAFSRMNELDSVAKEFNTTVKTIPNFTRDGGGEFAKGSPVIDAAFSEAVLEKGQNSPLVTIGEERALVVRINDHKLPEQKTLDQVRSEIVALLKDKAAKVAVEQ
ncbi:MAG TPA: SurA N-terminal domain-containing protein, partial [Steroidobacteraceae bacterium]|nr:SurA N-terminal domain-containing protein [Steroidobacteraceae bacterium]